MGRLVRISWNMRRSTRPLGFVGRMQLVEFPMDIGQPGTAAFFCTYEKDGFDIADASYLYLLVDSLATFAPCLLTRMPLEFRITS